MQSTKINFYSQTAMLNAYSILSANGIKSNKGKSSDASKGCIYTLSIYSDPQNAYNILKNNGIEFYTSGGVK